MIAPPRTSVLALRNPTAAEVFSAPVGAPDPLQPKVALQQEAARSSARAATQGPQEQALLNGYLGELQKAGTPAKQALTDKVLAFAAAQKIDTPADAIMEMIGM
jgi:hypothetical protein